MQNNLFLTGRLTIVVFYILLDIMGNLFNSLKYESYSGYNYEKFIIIYAKNNNLDNNNIDTIIIIIHMAQYIIEFFILINIWFSALAHV